MVLFFISDVLGEEEKIILYMGKDKYENEELLKYAYENDVWVHVDKLSSPHVYIRLPEPMTFESIPSVVLDDAAQLVKAGSILGNKKDNIKVLYTPASNIKKTGDMAIGSVSFHSSHKVRRVHVVERNNAIVNRLKKTQVEKAVDHEQDRVDREKERHSKKRLAANKQKMADLALARSRKEEENQKSYLNLHQAPTDEDENDAWERQQKIGDFDPNDDFM